MIDEMKAAQPIAAGKRPPMSRKAFLAGALAVGAAAILPKADDPFAQAAEEASSALEQDASGYGLDGSQMGFWIETSKCVDCGTCAHKCDRANSTPESQASRRKIVEAKNKRGETVFVSLSCMHCLDPSCMAVCPAGAISKREQDGAVMVNHDRCIGCKYCYEACPFSVPKYNEAGMYKCDFCIENGTYPNDAPACVKGCPHDALHFDSIERILAEHGDEAIPLTGITGPSIILSK